MPNPGSDQEWLRQLYEHISPSFYRSEPRQRAWAYLCNLLDTPADEGATRRHLACYPGERRSDGAQRLLTTAQWDEDQVKNDLAAFVTRTFGPHGGTFYVTEMAFRKKGTHAAGVRRQFSMETGRYENCQLGILLFYQAQDGSVLLIDRELYLPETWVDDPQRRAGAGIPADLGYRSKSAIAVSLVQRAVAAGIRPDWVLLSVLCTDQLGARHALRQAGLPHLMPLTAGELAPTASTLDPQGLNGRTGSVRLRRITLAGPPMPGFQVCHLVDTAANRPTGYHAFAPRDVTAQQLAEVAGNLRRLEGYCRRSREEIGIDRYEVRSWRGWYRHLTLAMVAHAAHTLSARESRRCYVY